MKILLGKCFLMAALLISLNVKADTWVDVDILSVRSFTTQTNQYMLVKDFSNPDQCSANGTVAIVRDDSNNWKMVHSNLLAAFLAGRKVRLRVGGCATSGNAIVTGIEVLKK